MSNTVSAEFLDAFANALSRHDADAIVSMMTDDCVMCLAAGPTHEGTRSDGKEAVRNAAIDLFERLPDVHWHNARHFIVGDRGVSEWTLKAATANGETVEANGCDVFQFCDGLIAIKDSYRKYAG